MQFSIAEPEAATPERHDRRERVGLKRRLARFMAARLLLCLAVLGIAVYFKQTGRGLESGAEVGLCVVLGAAFLTTVASAVVLSRSRHLLQLGALQIGIDISLITALVYVWGGSESVFAIGYALVTICAATLFHSRGAITAAAAASVAYGLVLMAIQNDWLPAYGEAGRASLSVVATVWGVHAGMLLLVAFLASLLAEESERAGRALDRRTSDLRRLQRLHQRTVESLTSGLLTADSVGIITSFNPEAERITGFTQEAAVGLFLERVLPGAAAAVFGDENKAPGRRRVRISYQTPKGEERYLGVAGSVLKDEAGQASGRVLIFQDVTDVVTMEVELRRSERLAAVGQMAADMAHELRNPLAAVLGSIQLLGTSFGDNGADAEKRRLVDIVQRETDRLNALLRDFLQYARPWPAVRGSVRLLPVVEELATLFHASQSATLEFQIDIDPRLAVALDPAQLRQLLWNLLLNAVEAMPGGGAIAVSARCCRPLPSQEAACEGRNAVSEGEGADSVEIAVSDNGVGISPEALERIFDPFFTTKADGTGLGLATVHRIVENHGGSVRVESKLHQGTTFFLCLPLSGDGR